APNLCRQFLMKHYALYNIIQIYKKIPHNKFKKGQKGTEWFEQRIWLMIKQLAEPWKLKLMATIKKTSYPRLFFMTEATRYKIASISTKMSPYKAIFSLALIPLPKEPRAEDII
ncbi:hypothetical protein ACJX0J_040029, partial [Zea mays]